MHHQVKLVFICLSLVLFSCRKDDIIGVITLGVAKPYEIEYPTVITDNIPKMVIPDDNPMTVQGVELGRKLFYDNILSGDHTQACASCHSPTTSFTDTAKFSIGINGQKGTINSMPLINLGWSKAFFWNGRAATLEEQAFGPVTNPLEMNNTWKQVVKDLQFSSDYPQLFHDAFGTNVIDSVLVSKALAQFERTLISGNAPYDLYSLGLPNGYSKEENENLYSGLNIFMGNNCHHCHGDPTNPTWTDNQFHNNGLDVVPDLGHFEVTGNAAHIGEFKTPTLRNLIYTAPYMHDGRFETLEEVINHYDSEIQISPTLDDIFSDSEHDIDLDAQDREWLLFFLKSLSDPSFNTNPDFQKP